MNDRQFALSRRRPCGVLRTLPHEQRIARIWLQARTAYVRAEGTNALGRKFANYYHFMPCGERLVLASIAENPQ
jgi:hypothetical protein